jgi:hypothetical protein
MPRLKVDIFEQKKQLTGEVWRFRVGVEWTRKGKPEHIKFEQLCPDKEYTREKLKQINENFANSIRICKHAGGYLRDGTPDQEARNLLDKWSSTNTGMAVKVGDDPLPEFERFLF